MATPELLEVDHITGQIVGQVSGRATRGLSRDAVRGQTAAEPPHDGPDDEESDELDEKHPLELDTLLRWSSRAQAEGVGRKAELCEAGVGLGERHAIVVEGREDGDADDRGAGLGVSEAQLAGVLGLVAGVVELAEVKVEAGPVGERKGAQRRVFELGRESLCTLDVGEPLVDAEVELGEAEVGVGELADEAADSRIRGNRADLCQCPTRDRHRRGSVCEEALACLGELGRERRLDRAETAVRTDLNPDLDEPGREEGPLEGVDLAEAAHGVEEVQGVGRTALGDESFELGGERVVERLRAKR